MKNNKILAAILVAAMSLSLLSGCGKDAGKSPDSATQNQAENQTPKGENGDANDKSEEDIAGGAPITVTDMTGREITLEEPATKIVALTPADCEILYAIGAGNTLVGRGEYCNIPAEVLDIPAVQSGAETNIEQIIALKPQVLLMTAMAQTEEQIQQLENAGIHVVVSDAQDIDGVYTAIEMIGTLLGKNEEAATVINEMKATFAEVTEQAKGDGTETVYFEVSPLEYGLWTAGADTFMDEIATMLGLKNCFSDVSGWGEISEEQVLSRNPDYIVTIQMYFGEGPTPTEEILSRPGWENVTAVANNKILNLQDDELSRPGPRLSEGARLLHDFVYSEAESGE